MIAIYVLISLISQFAPTGVALTALDMTPDVLCVHFDELNGIRVGSFVVVDGRVVGSVAHILQAKKQGERQCLQAMDSDQAVRKSQVTSKDVFQVILELPRYSRAHLQQGTVALITSPLSMYHANPDTLVELLSPIKSEKPALRNQATIAGYSSYLRFWSVPSTDEVFDS